MTLPARTRDYIGPVTDTRIWDHFTLRPGDVVLSTPPKCGTTWSQSILMMLIHGAAITDRTVWLDSLWLDFGPTDQHERAAIINAQSHQRCIKSHSPFDSIPYDPQAIYIAVHRHPIDMHFSMMKHIENWDKDIMDHLAPPEPGAAFARFLASENPEHGTDDLSLAAFLLHYRSFAKFAHLPNVHLFHYADLKADHAGMIRQYAQAIGCAASDALVEDIRAATAFDSMKDIARKNPPPADSGAFTAQEVFFNAGNSNKWEGRLSETELAAYRTRFAELASPEEIKWLENGSQRG